MCVPATNDRPIDHLSLMHAGRRRRLRASTDSLPVGTLPAPARPGPGREECESTVRRPAQRGDAVALI